MNRRVARYRQIADALKERITSRTLLPGARLPNQRALAREFGVTLMTLRQALSLLEREGLLACRHGLGTFVAAQSIGYDILQFRSLAGDLRSDGSAVDTRVLRARFVRADRRVQAGLGLNGTDRVFLLERLRLVNGRPLGLQRSFLREEVGEEISKADLSVTPLRQVLAFKLGIEIAGAREEIFAVKLREREARPLGCQPGAPAFCSERVSWGRARKPVVFDRVFVPGDRFRITRQLHYKESGP